MIELRVLGPIEVWRDGAAVALGGRRQRALLALLLIRAGRVVDSEQLIDELWSGEPPAGASTTLRSYVTRLRHALADAAPITATASGYRLDVAAEAIDSLRFESLVREAEVALRQRSAKRAAESLEVAAALWRGRPFGDLGDEGPLRDEAQRLEELRLHAVEERVEAQLMLGRAAELVDEIEALVRAHPYRERLWRQLMLALYRAERQADALAAYRRARRMLDEQLGIEPSEELQALQGAILRHEVPPAEPAEERHNLPAALTSFVGRRTELDEIVGLLRTRRLVTLTGVGGVGKTRLAIEAARSVVPEFGDGVFLVDLASLLDGRLLGDRIARVIDVAQQPDRAVAELLTARLERASLLLVLDNCEHLANAIAPLVATLLAASPRLHVLATSRVLLGVGGEVAYPVPALRLESTDAATRSEAVELFLARAGTADVELRSVPQSDARLALAERICRELDGIPLAIELAAARARALSLDEIADKLADRFRFLVAWRRLTAARHQTLREAMDWSYELLDARERSLLRSMSVFVGGATLQSLAEVCLGGDRDLALRLTESLVDASLVIPVRTPAATRYRLLETVRQYAAERLAEEAGADAVRERHADHFLALAEDAWVPMRTAAETTVAGLALELDDIRAALGWFAERDEPAKLLRLAEAMWWFWWLHGDAAEGRAWLATALERATGADAGLRARAWQGAAGLAWAQADLDAAESCAEQGRAAYATLETIELPSGPASGRLGEAACLNTLGLVALARGDLPAARERFERHLEMVGALDDDAWAGQHRAIAQHNLASVAVEAGDLDTAARLYAESLASYRAAEDNEGAAMAELYLGLTDIYAGHPAAAADHLLAALKVYRKVAFVQYLTECLEAAALVAAAGSGRDAAAELLGAAAGMRERSGNRANGRLASEIERTLAETRRELGDAAFESRWQAGLALRAEEAVARADEVLRA